MAKFSQKLGGKEVGQASVYAAPHNMAGGPMEMKKYSDPMRQVASDFKPGKPTGRVSLGDPAREDTKTDGIKVRGTGAATKGLKARGPMA